MDKKPQVGGIGVKGDCKGGAWNRARLCEMEGA